jgi:putative peptide zinc metalloprotease protein
MRAAHDMSSIAAPLPARRAPSDPIAVRRRCDLVVTAVDRGEGAAGEWVVKDPLSKRYFRFAEHEYFLFERLDGRIDADGLCREFNAAFAPRTITRPRLAQFLTMVLRAGLVHVDTTGRGRFLDLRRRNRLSDERRSRWHGIPSIRFRGVDPTRLLDAFMPLGRASFSLRGLVCFGLLLAFATGTAVGHWDQLVRELRQAPTRLQFGGFGALVVAVIAMKVLHELAHGLACRRFGGECRELGLMWVLCTPLPYCDVSDAWTFPNRWRRVTVAAAGILAETLVAAVAIVCWRFTSPGPLHDVCLFLGAVALVNTLVINANPLMRFDGYFALCDALNVPNLADRSSQALRRFFSGFGRSASPDRSLRPHFGYLAYGIASRCYRVAVLIGVALFVLQIGRSLEVAWLAWLFIAWLVGTSTGLVGSRRLRMNVAPSSPSTGKMVRRAAIAGLIGVALFVPFRRSIVGSLVVEPSMREPVAITTPGRIESIAVRYGQAVAAGDVIAVLNNPELETKIARLAGERNQLEAQLRHLRRSRNTDPSAATELGRVEELLQTLDRQLAILRSEQDRLTLTARSGGTLVPPVATKPDEGRDRLPVWSGLPLERQNEGASLDPGVVLGEIAATDSWQAVVTLDDGEAARLRVGDEALVRLESRGELFSGVVKSVVPVSGESVDRSDRVAPTGASPGSISGSTIRYRVVVGLRVKTPPCPGEGGEIRFDLQPESLFGQARRWISRTFLIAG